MYNAHRSQLHLQYNRSKIKPIFAKAHSYATRRHKYIERHFLKTEEAGSPLNKLEHQNFRAAVLEFTDRTTWQAPYAVTLTLKQAAMKDGAYKKIDAINASDNLRHFLNRLNRSLLGRTATRKGEGLACFAVYEGTSVVRPHYHLCLDRPANITFERFAYEIDHAWQATDFGYYQTDITPCSNLNGWLDYMTKRNTKTDFASSIDWNNTQPGA
jgi:hypothetical protein